MLGVNWARGSQRSARPSLVTVVRDEKVMDVAGVNIDTHVLRKMLDQSMIQFTGKKSVRDAREPWPLSPPSLCLEAADKVYGLGTSRLQEIKIEHFGWEMNLLL